MMCSRVSNRIVRCASGGENSYPAKLQPSCLSTVKFRSNKPNDHASSDVSSSSRRAVIFSSIATLPCLLPLTHIFGSLQANAMPPGTKEYLLIKEELRKVLTKGKAAGVLRLVFHDAGTFEIDDNTGGMNGSIVYELERPENTGLKKSVKVLQKAKTQIDAIHPVSWADVIAVAGTEAVEVCGGPTITVSLGRQDSPGPDPEGKLPEETLDASGLKRCFHKKGFSTQELVALSGAHTLGSKGFGSPTSFDNSYYKVLLEKPWTPSGGMSTMIGLPSDHALVEDDECLRWIKKYAENENMFFEDFKNVYVKLVNSGVKWNSL
ncbi:putative L-ascorbate peroxidase [Medicago truncatula]|uniref:L-ascorbate peroxidase n=1 Tax=Medicago truncatula TaxID=3880 RepID=G7JB12_MEDTR|nr:putative L-ascorbate peroxidase 6 [Medicago truncatula]AES73640.1 L-ascorbate peroxidase [Medicago truncatula]RHN70639.1 putative L-ascorbate peroxidase [Medicago truncatula]